MTKTKTCRSISALQVTVYILIFDHRPYYLLDRSLMQDMNAIQCQPHISSSCWLVNLQQFQLLG